MATESQMKANKANAQFSTGPTSKEGKNISRWNALTHGYYAKVVLLPGQTQEEWQEMLTNSVRQHGGNKPPAISLRRAGHSGGIQAGASARLRNRGSREGSGNHKPGFIEVYPE